MTNSLKIIIYSTGDTVSQMATHAALSHEGLTFTTFYPGGVFGVANFFVPMKATNPHDFKAGYRVGIFSGLTMFWEGAIDGIVYVSTPSAEGLNIECTGYWGYILKRRRWNKVWCDTRLTENKWPWTITAGMQESKFREDRYNRLRITPVETSFAQYDDASFTYAIPTGQTINRITGTYAMHEGTQAWAIDMKDVGAGTTLFSTISASGTAAFAGTPDAGCGTVGFYFFNSAACTVDYDEDIYAQITNVKVYGYSGTPTSTAIIKDIRANFTDLSADETLINTNAQVIEPAYMEGETLAEYMSKLAAFGDTSLNTWACGVFRSTGAQAIDHKPVVYFEQQRELTDYEYVIRLDEALGGLKIERVYSEIVNYIILDYTDVNGNRTQITPNDDANLKDDTSIASYGRRDARLNLGNAGETEAKIYARRYLELFKDPKFRMDGNLTLTGNVRTKGTYLVPVFDIRAGLRIMIEDYLQEIGGSGLIFLITATSYNEDTDRITITAGTPNPLETMAARRRGI